MPTLMIPPGGLGVMGTAPGLSRQLYRRALSAILGRHQVFVTDELAVAPDGARHIIASALRDDEGERAAYGRGWVNVLDGANVGAIRRILGQGFEGNLHILRVTRPFASMLEVGTALEYHERAPSSTTEGVLGLNQMVDAALRNLWTPGLLSYLTASGKESYALPSWVDDDWFVEDVLDPPLAAGSVGQSRKTPWRLRFDEGVGSVEIRPAIDDGYSLGVAVRRPGDSWINGSESSTGLLVDTDVALLPVIDVITVGALCAYRWFAAEGGAASEANKAQLAYWEDQARRLPRYWPRGNLGASPYVSAAAPVAKAAV